MFEDQQSVMSHWNKVLMLLDMFYIKYYLWRQWASLLLLFICCAVYCRLALLVMLSGNKNSSLSFACVKQNLHTIVRLPCATYSHEYSVTPYQRGNYASQKSAITRSRALWNHSANCSHRSKIVPASNPPQRVGDGVVGGRARSSRLHRGSGRPSQLYPPGRRRRAVAGRIAARRPLPSPGGRRRAGARRHRRGLSAGQVLVGFRSHGGCQ